MRCRSQSTRAFRAVIEGCATAGTERETTWINPTIRRLYGQLFSRGYVHTIEVWDGAAHNLVAENRALRQAGGYQLCDTQFVTDHLRTFGGIEIPREDYEVRLAEALTHKADWSAIDRSA